MGKMCEKCLKKYEDSQNVCLLCGSELKAEEECRKVCEEKGKTPEEKLARNKYLKPQLFILAVVVIVLILVYLALSRGMEFFVKVGERLLVRY
ncbi:MAG: hypothetical protein WBD24_02145 [Candidatus Omnitrophota bacterium]